MRLFANRSAGDLFQPGADIMARLCRAGGSAVALGGAQAATIAWLATLGTRSGHAQPYHWLLLVSFAVALNLSIALSKKYQVFIFHRQYPYIFAFYSFCLLSWAVVSFVAWCSTKPDPTRRAYLADFSFVVPLSCLTAKASNASVLTEPAETYGAGVRAVTYR